MRRRDCLRDREYCPSCRGRESACDANGYVVDLAAYQSSTAQAESTSTTPSKNGSSSLSSTPYQPYERRSSARTRTGSSTIKLTRLRQLYGVISGVCLEVVRFNNSAVVVVRV